MKICMTFFTVCFDLISIKVFFSVCINAFACCLSVSQYVISFQIHMPYQCGTTMMDRQMSQQCVTTKSATEMTVVATLLLDGPSPPSWSLSTTTKVENLPQRIFMCISDWEMVSDPDRITLLQLGDFEMCFLDCVNLLSFSLARSTWCTSPVFSLSLSLSLSLSFYLCLSLSLSVSFSLSLSLSLSVSLSLSLCLSVSLSLSFRYTSMLLEH